MWWCKNSDSSFSIYQIRIFPRFVFLPNNGCYAHINQSRRRLAEQIYVWKHECPWLKCYQIAHVHSDLRTYWKLSVYLGSTGWKKSDLSFFLCFKYFQLERVSMMEFALSCFYGNTEGYLRERLTVV